MTNTHDIKQNFMLRPLVRTKAIWNSCVIQVNKFVRRIVYLVIYGLRKQEEQFYNFG